jgi:hypothetical protein
MNAIIGLVLLGYQVTTVSICSNEYAMGQRESAFTKHVEIIHHRQEIILYAEGHCKKA